MMILALRLHRAWWSTLGLGTLILAGIAMDVHAGAGASSRAAGARPALAAVDHRFVLHPRAMAFGGDIDRGAILSGTVSPSLPGLNKLHVSIRLPHGRAARGGRVRLVLSMPGMSMAPVAATLAAHGPGYSGQMALPMFGSYRAQVRVMTAGGRYTGGVTITLPLELESSDGSTVQH